MTLEERNAVKLQDAINENEMKADYYRRQSESGCDCAYYAAEKADDYQQIADWLKELKAYR